MSAPIVTARTAIATTAHNTTMMPRPVIALPAHAAATSLAESRTSQDLGESAKYVQNCDARRPRGGARRPGRRGAGLGPWSMAASPRPPRRRLAPASETPRLYYERTRRIRRTRRRRGGPAAHGLFGGWEQGLSPRSSQPERLFRVIAPSRPGYLGTFVDRSPRLPRRATRRLPRCPMRSGSTDHGSRRPAAAPPPMSSRRGILTARPVRAGGRRSASWAAFPRRRSRRWRRGQGRASCGLLRHAPRATLSALLRATAASTGCRASAAIIAADPASRRSR